VISYWLHEIIRLPVQKIAPRVPKGANHEKTPLTCLSGSTLNVERSSLPFSLVSSCPKKSRGNSHYHLFPVKLFSTAESNYNAVQAGNRDGRIFVTLVSLPPHSRGRHSSRLPKTPGRLVAAHLCTPNWRCEDVAFADAHDV
jgi:hypothetical protein